jgi:hypothetical protein
MSILVPLQPFSPQALRYSIEKSCPNPSPSFIVGEGELKGTLDVVTKDLLK